MIEPNFNSKLIERIVDDKLNEMIEINTIPIQINHRSRTVNHLTVSISVIGSVIKFT